MEKILLKVKPFQETLQADMCGPASLKIVLDYYGIEKLEKELAKLCKIKKGLGWNDKDIKKVAEKLGFKVEIKNNSSFKDIEKWLKKGAPVIVDWFTRGRNEFIYVQDPEIGKIRKIKRDDFMRVWFDFSGEYIKVEELIVRQIIAIYK